MKTKDPAALVAEREMLLREFEEVVRACLHGDPEAGKFKVVGATFNPMSGAVKPRWKGLTSGRPAERDGFWTPARETLVELLARTWELRSLRWNRLTGTVRPPDAGWVEALRAKHPGVFDCEMSVGAGWADLITATCNWIFVSGETLRFEQIKEKFGTLRLYYDGGGEIARDVTTTAESVAAAYICDVCGAPGHFVDSGWMRTRCDRHEVSK